MGETSPMLEVLKYIYIFISIPPSVLVLKRFRAKIMIQL